jgi:cell division protein ZapB
MDIFDTLEERVDRLLARKKALEEENEALKAELAKLGQDKQAVATRIDKPPAKTAGGTGCLIPGQARGAAGIDRLVDAQLYVVHIGLGAVVQDGRGS